MICAFLILWHDGVLAYVKVYGIFHECTKINSVVSGTKCVSHVFLAFSFFCSLTPFFSVSFFMLWENQGLSGRYDLITNYGMKPIRKNLTKETRKKNHTRLELYSLLGIFCFLFLSPVKFFSLLFPKFDHLFCFFCVLSEK